MPFKSISQRRFLFAKHPSIAKRWASETPKGVTLPDKVKTPSPLNDYFDKLKVKK